MKRLNRTCSFDIILFMISLKVKDVNNFMHKLLISDTFDNFLLCDGEIAASCIITFNGRINQKFFDTDELTSLTDDFVYWRNIKHIAYEAIKGNKVPSKMKIVFALSKTKYEETISKSGMHITSDEIGGLYIHILYEVGQIEVITGTSLNTFTMDKTLDGYWDKTVTSFFHQHFDCKVL